MSKSPASRPSDPKETLKQPRRWSGSFEAKRPSTGRLNCIHLATIHQANEDGVELINGREAAALLAERGGGSVIVEAPAGNTTVRIGMMAEFEFRDGEGAVASIHWGQDSIHFLRACHERGERSILQLTFDGDSVRLLAMHPSETAQ